MAIFILLEDPVFYAIHRSRLLHMSVCSDEVVALHVAKLQNGRCSELGLPEGENNGD